MEMDPKRMDRVIFPLPDPWLFTLQGRMWENSIAIACPGSMIAHDPTMTKAGWQ